MEYQLVLSRSCESKAVYNVKHNGKIMKNDIKKTFEIEVNHMDKRIFFRCSTISSSDTYNILSLIRKEISRSYNIKCI